MCGVGQRFTSFMIVSHKGSILEVNGGAASFVTGLRISDISGVRLVTPLRQKICALFEDR